MDVDVLNGLSSEDQVLYLREHGYGLKGVFDGEEWCLDSLCFLRRNDAVIGILQSGEYTPKELWDALVVLDDACVVYKMWKPFEDILNGNVPFHILKDDGEWSKHKVRLDLNRHRVGKRPRCRTGTNALSRTPYTTGCPKSVLMSSKDEFILCRPSNNGWKSKPLLQYDTMLPHEKTLHINNILIHLIQEHGKTNNIDMYYRYMAHFNYTMALRLGIRVPHDLFSELSEEEEKLLRNMRKACWILITFRIDRRDKRWRNAAIWSSNRHKRHDRMVMLLGLFLVVTYGTFFGC